MARSTDNPTLVPDRDRPLLDTPMGRENDHGLAERGGMAEDEITDKDIPTQPRSAVTARHDGENDTDDGLTETEEEVREFAEDLAVGKQPDRTTVFDKRLTPPKV